MLVPRITLELAGNVRLEKFNGCDEGVLLEKSMVLKFPADALVTLARELFVDPANNVPLTQTVPAEKSISAIFVEPFDNSNNVFECH